MEKFNASLSYDKRMWKEDIQVGLINLLLCLFGFFVEFSNFFIHFFIHSYTHTFIHTYIVLVDHLCKHSLI